MRLTNILLAIVVICASAAGEAPEPAERDGDIAVYFSPNGGAADAVIHHIASAEKSIDIAAYSITHVRIAKAIIDAHRRGIRVRVLMDRTQAAGRYSSATTLHNAEVEVWIDATGGLMHHKFILVDGKTVLTGSFNLTAGGDERNAENLIVIQGREKLAAAFAAEFEKLLPKARRYERPAEN